MEAYELERLGFVDEHIYFTSILQLFIDDNMIAFNEVVADMEYSHREEMIEHFGCPYEIADNDGQADYDSFVDAVYAAMTQRQFEFKGEIYNHCDLYPTAGLWEEELAFVNKMKVGQVHVTDVSGTIKRIK